nr:hypothetical protein BaRGS_024214 [Batillaria attramentaria]
MVSGSSQPTDYLKAEVEKAPAKKSSEQDDDSPKPCSMKKVESIYDFMRSPTNHLYTMFLAYPVKVYDGVLVKLQAEEPMIHQLLPSLKKLLLSLYSRFLKPVAVAGKEVTEVQYLLQSNQKTDSDLLIGDAARQFITNAGKNKLRESRVKEFYLNVRRYYEVTLTYLLKKLPLQDALLQHALIVDPAMQMQATLDDLRFFIKKYPCLLPQGTSSETVEEFATYQVADVAGLKSSSERVDVFWAGVKQQHPVS